MNSDTNQISSSIDSIKSSLQLQHLKTLNVFSLISVLLAKMSLLSVVLNCDYDIVKKIGNNAKIIQNLVGSYSLQL